METIITVFEVGHYDLGENKGLSVRVVGGHQVTNNKFGVSVSESPVLDYNELNYLKQFEAEGKLPAKFKAQMTFATKKDKNNKEITTAAFKNLQFLNRVELKDVLPAK